MCRRMDDDELMEVVGETIDGITDDLEEFSKELNELDQEKNAQNEHEDEKTP